MRRKKHGSDGVKLNLAAMLDMAFQLLAFFILTYKPAPVEGQLALHLPAPAPINKPEQPQPIVQDPPKRPQVPGVEAIVITVKASGTGEVGSVQMLGRNIFTGAASSKNLASLNLELREMLKFKDPPYEQVVIRAGRNLQYNELMKVIDVCAKQQMPNGKRLNNIRFTEIAGEVQAGG